MEQRCIDKIKKEIVPILDSIPTKYENTHPKGNFHLCCYFHCINHLQKNKHEEFLNKCIECVKFKKEFCNELENYNMLKRKYDVRGYTYYLDEIFKENFKIIFKRHITQKTKDSCPVEKKTRQIKELTEFIHKNNLKMNEHLMKLGARIVVQIPRRKLLLQKFMGDCLDEFLEEQIEEDILKVASQLV